VRCSIKVAVIILLFVSAISAQFYFGRNKIQYQPFDWHVLSTPHFEIYYYKEEEELATSGAFFAEESYKDLEQKFNFTLLKKVPLIFYSSHLHFQQTNTFPYLIPEGVGGFFEFIKGRVVIPYDGSTYQFERVIKHELVHVFMHNKISQILRMYNIMTYRSPPLWFTEGLAEYWSSGWDSKAEMVIRDALLNDYLVPLNRLDMVSGFLLYKEGQSFLRFVDTVYGQDKILLILEGIWKDSDFYRVIEDVLGKSFSEILSDWRYNYKKNIYPLLETREAAKVSTIPLTKQGINSAPAYFSSEKSENVIFLTNRTGYSDIYIQKLEPQNRSIKPKLLLQGEREAALESLHFLQTGIDVNSQGILVFPSKSGESDVLNFFDINQEEIVDTFRDLRISSISYPKWSDSGNHVVFSGTNWKGFQDVYLLDFEQMLLTQLTNDFYADRQPSLSPDGNFVVFSSDRGKFGSEGFFNLFLYNLQDNTIRTLTEGKFNDISPVWSKKHPNRLAFSSDRDGSYNIWVQSHMSSHIIPLLPSQNTQQIDTINIHIPEPSPVTHIATGAFDPHWSGNDDQDLLFSAFEDYRFNVHLVENVDSIISKETYKTTTFPFSEYKTGWQRLRLKVEGDKKNFPYKKKYTFDISQTMVAYDPIFGFLGGAQVTMSDLLGDYYYHYLLFNTAESSSEFLGRFNIAVSRVDLSHRVNNAIGVFHFANDYFTYTDGFFFERRYGAQFALSYPFSVFQRIETTSSAWKAERDLYFDRESFSAFLVSNSISYVFDNSIWGSVGPVDGTSVRLTLGRTIDFSRSRIYYTGILGDIRKYFRTSLRTLYALRIMTWLNEGRDVYRFRIGGSWGLRGYKRTQVAGQSFFLVNNEFRFPFAQALLLRFSSFDISVSPIRGALFFDLGNAWEDKPTKLLGSYGFGLRGNFLGFIVLRLDIGKTTESKRIFTQIFFGWNY